MKMKKEKSFKLPGPDELNEPPKSILEYCICLFGEKGIGKTSLAAQFPDAVVGMLEPRRRNLRIRMVSLDQDWAYTKEFIQACIEDDSVKTVVIDTIDRAYAQCLASACEERGIKDPGQMNDYGATWRAIKDEFEATMNSVLYAEKGLIFISHAQHKDMEMRTGETRALLVPTCSPAAFNYVKAVCDYAFYFGYHGSQRALYLRGHEDLWTGCGSSDHFCDPEGNPVRTILLGETPVEAFDTFIRSFNNQVLDADYVGEEKPRKMKLPKKAVN
jgi:hypothetical protein